MRLRRFKRPRRGYLLSDLARVFTNRLRGRRPVRLGLKLSPASLGESISLQQRLTVQRDDRIDQLDAALEIDAESVHLMILMLGRRMLSLVFDGQAVETWRDPAVPAQLRAEDVLEDLQLTLWRRMRFAVRCRPDGPSRSAACAASCRSMRRRLL